MKSIQHIKQIGILLLIGIYAYVLLKPIIPIAKDLIAHTFYEFEHLAVIHYENGTYHLHTELKKEADELDHQPKENKSKESTQKIDTHHSKTSFLSEFKSLLLNADRTPKIKIGDLSFFDEIYLSMSSPPPEFS